MIMMKITEACHCLFIDNNLNFSSHQKLHRTVSPRTPRTWPESCCENSATKLGGLEGKDSEGGDDTYNDSFKEFRRERRSPLTRRRASSFSDEKI